MTAAFGPVWLPAGPVTLRPWTPADAPAVLAALQDSDIVRWNGAAVSDLAAAQAWVRSRADWSDGDHASFAISATGDLALLGSVSLHQIDVVQGDAEVGYWVAPDARGQGLAARAVMLVYRWAFAVLPLDRIDWLTRSRTRRPGGWPRPPASRWRAGCEGPTGTATASSTTSCCGAGCVRIASRPVAPTTAPYRDRRSLLLRATSRASRSTVPGCLASAGRFGWR